MVVRRLLFVVRRSCRFLVVGCLLRVVCRVLLVFVVRCELDLLMIVVVC